MSKSLGNFWTIRDAISKVHPLELRYCLINAPYRQPVEFNDVMLEDSSSHYRRLISAYGEGLSLCEKKPWENSEFLKSTSTNFSNGMNDDFNTRVAIVEVQSVVKYLKEKIDENNSEEISASVSWLSYHAGSILGLLPMVFELTIKFSDQEVLVGAPSSQWWAQLSSTIAGGLTFATILTLLATPALLVLGYGINKFLKSKCKYKFFISILV